MADPRIDVVVLLDGEDVLAGRVTSHRRHNAETSSFSYDLAYIGRDGAYALDPRLPLAEGPFQAPQGHALFGAFADAAPDRWGRNLIKRDETRRASAAGVAARSLGEIDFLLGVRDDFRQGALRFRDPATESFLAADDRGVPQLIDLPALVQASEHLDEGSETDEELHELLRAGSSLGGARPKAHVVHANGQLSIAKFPRNSQDVWNVGTWEKVALDLASSAGITVPESALMNIDGRSVLILRRFDRVDGRRVGYVSAMTMVEGTDGDVGSYLDIASKIEEVSPEATRDLHELWRRIAFSILISNTDDHLRNHGFLHERGTSWELSPAFDMNPTPDPGPKQLRTAIDGYDTAASVELLISVAEFFRLKEFDAAHVLGDVLASTDRWRETARHHGLTRIEVEEMAPAFEHPQVDIARTFAAQS